MAHGTIFQRPGRYGIATHARPDVSTTCPETNDGPVVAVPPRMIASGSVIAGRSRTITFHTIRSAASFVNVTSAAATASRHRLNESAAITTIGPIASVPRHWTPSATGSNVPGRPLIASNTARSGAETVPWRTMNAHRRNTASPARPTTASRRRRTTGMRRSLGAGVGARERAEQLVPDRRARAEHEHELRLADQAGGVVAGQHGP